jgi:hypothetical protein
MKHLTIIVPEGQNNLSSIVGPYKIFIRANEYWKEHTSEELFKSSRYFKRSGIL